MFKFQDNHSEFIVIQICFVRNPWDRVVSWYNFSMYLSNLENVEKENITGKDFLSYIKNFKYLETFSKINMNLNVVTL